jgi:hypothetical protein
VLFAEKLTKDFTFFGISTPDCINFGFDEDMVDSEIANTLIHEILHGITHVFGVKFRDSEQEEDVVNSFGGGLATLFQDNKELLVWLLETFHPEDE